jgi:branched-chain amino acid transport system substrate-binding protein
VRGSKRTWRCSIGSDRAVAITAALSGAVLLTSVNAQLGGIGYTIAAEYVFYVFFGLSLLCILSVLMAERLRTRGAQDTAMVVERWTRVAFELAVIAVLGGASLLAHPLSS